MAAAFLGRVSGRNLQFSCRKLLPRCLERGQVCK